MRANPVLVIDIPVALGVSGALAQLMRQHRAGLLEMVGATCRCSRDALFDLPPVSAFLVPFHCRLHALGHQSLDQIGTDDILAEAFFLKQLEALQRRPWVCQVLEVWRSAPVLEIVEVCDKRGVRQELSRGKVVEVLWVGEGLDKLCRVSEGGGGKGIDAIAPPVRARSA